MRRSLLTVAALLVFLLSASSNPALAATIEFPHRYVQFTTAGHGRYLAFHFDEPGKVVVYDAARAEPVFEIAQVASGDLLAGSSEKIVVVSPSGMMLRRFDLASGKRDKVAVIPGDDVPVEALIGCSGAGPLLLVGRKHGAFFDLRTLRILEIRGPGIGGRGRYGRSVHVSSEGRTFATIPTGYGPVGYSVIHLDEDISRQVRFGSTSNAIRWSQPSGDGHLLLQPEGRVVNRNGRSIAANWLKGAALIPSIDPRYFVAVRVNHRDVDGNRVAKIAFCSTADCRELFSETGYEELVPAKINSWHDIAGALRLGHEWRVQFVPDRNILVTLPRGNTKMIVRAVDLQKRLKELKDGFLYVESLAPLTASFNRMFDYRVRARSSSKGIVISLADGPPGARIRKNRVQWRVPRGFAEQWARFLVEVKDASGREVFHSFEVAVQREGSVSE